MIEIKARVLGTNKVLILIHALCTMQYIVLICAATLPGGHINTFNILKNGEMMMMMLVASANQSHNVCSTFFPFLRIFSNFGLSLAFHLPVWFISSGHCRDDSFSLFQLLCFIFFSRLFSLCLFQVLRLPTSPQIGKYMLIRIVKASCALSMLQNFKEHNVDCSAPEC